MPCAAWRCARAMPTIMSAVDLSVEREVLAPTGARVVERDSLAEFRRRTPEAAVLLVNAVAPIDHALIGSLTRCQARSRAVRIALSDAGARP